MKYLHDNGFKVLILNQFGYDTNNNVFYITDNKPAGVHSGGIATAAYNNNCPKHICYYGSEKLRDKEMIKIILPS